MQVISGFLRAVVAGVFLLTVLVAPPSSAAAPVAETEGTSARPTVVREQARADTFRIGKKHFGIHSYEVRPGTRSGAIRFVESWRGIQKASGFGWQTLDSHIAKAESWGFGEIMYAIYGTPEWVGAKVASPEQEQFGRRSTAHPRRLSDWRDFVKKLVRRYKGRIDTYQVWNEATGPQFYQGSPKKLARMTKVLYDVAHRIDPAAKVLSASMQTHNKAWFTRLVPPYLRHLGRLGWPIDGFAGHFYPVSGGGPNETLKQLRMFNRALDRAGLPDRVERLNTEVNYDVGPTPDGRDHPRGRVRGTKAAIYVARTFLDGWRNGLRGQYWYAWTPKHYVFPGVQMFDTSLPGVAAYNTLASWTIGAKFRGCSKGRTVECRFKEGGSRFRIVFTTKGKTRLPVKGRQNVCLVTGNKCESVRGSVKVTQVPLRVRGW